MDVDLFKKKKKTPKHCLSIRKFQPRSVRCRGEACTTHIMHRTRCHVRWRTALATTCQYDTPKTMSRPAGPLVSDGLIMWKFSRLTRIEGFPLGSCMGPCSTNVEYRMKLSDVTFFFRTRRVLNRPDRTRHIRS